MAPAAVRVTLAASERKILKERVRGAKTCWRDRLRAQVVLAAARGRGNERIAADLGTCVSTVRKWRGRFPRHQAGGDQDHPQCGAARWDYEQAPAVGRARTRQGPAATTRAPARSPRPQAS